MSARRHTSAEVARILNVTPRHVPRLVVAGIVRANRIGRRGWLRFSAAELARLRKLAKGTS